MACCHGNGQWDVLVLLCSICRRSGGDHILHHTETWSGQFLVIFGLYCCVGISYIAYFSLSFLSRAFCLSVSPILSHSIRLSLSPCLILCFSSARSLSLSFSLSPCLSASVCACVCISLFLFVCLSLLFVS